MATAGDQINAALRLIGQLAEGETASAETSADALAALNQMIDAWALSSLSVYAMQDQALTWASGNATRTLGPSGQIVGNRPVSLDPSTYYTVGAESFPIAIISQDDYNAIALKSSTSPYPEYLTIDYTVPNLTLTLYPVPTVNLSFHFMSVLELTQPAVLATTLVLPPGYLRAFKYNLACEIAAEFGVEASPTVQRIAASSKRAIKRNNVKPEDMLMSLPGLLARSHSDIFAG